MSRPVARAQVVLALALLLALFPACGDGGGADGPVDAGGESWPLSVETLAVLGYIALRAPAADVSELVDDQFGWRPEGLADGRPLLLVPLDASVLGGDLAFVLPIDDPGAFESSLGASPAVDDLGGRKFHIRLPPEHPFAAAQRAFMGMSESGPSPGALVQAFTSQQEFVIALQLRFEGDWALLVPSYEAGVVTARVLSEIPGLLRDTPETLVLNVDIERVVDTYYDQLQGAKAQLRSLLLGQQLGGFAGAFMQAAQRRGGEGDAVDQLPVSGPFLWTLLELLRLDDVRGLQLSTTGVDAFTALRDPESFVDGDTPAAGAADVRLAFYDDSDWNGLLSALRPAPELPGAILALSADPDVFAEALASWARPLVEFVHGEGPPAERSLGELAELLRPWGGLLTVFQGGDGRDGREGDAVLGLATRGDFDPEGAGAWLDEVADAAAWDGERPWSSRDGASRDTGGDSAGDPTDGGADGGLLPAEWEWLRFDDVLVLSDGRAAVEHEDVVERVREGRDGWVDPAGPALRVRLSDDGPVQGLRALDGELRLQLRWGAASDPDAPPAR